MRDDAETLDDILKAPNKPAEDENVVDGEFPKKPKHPQKRLKKTANPDKLVPTEYPNEEIPNFDEEASEVLEEISLFEGNTINIKE